VNLNKSPPRRQNGLIEDRRVALLTCRQRAQHRTTSPDGTYERRPLGSGDRKRQLDNDPLRKGLPKMQPHEYFRNA